MTDYFEKVHVPTSGQVIAVLIDASALQSMDMAIWNMP